MGVAVCVCGSKGGLTVTDPDDCGGAAAELMCSVYNSECE